MKRRTITIATVDGLVEQRVWVTDTPGLVIAQPQGDLFTVTHAASGRMVSAHFVRKDSAIMLADMLNGLTDWTALEVPRLKDIPGVDKCIDDCLERDFALTAHKQPRWKLEA